MAHIEKFYEKSSQGGGGGGGLSWSHHDRIAIGKQQDNTHNDENSNSHNDGPWATAIEDATAYAFVTAVADNDNDNKHNGHGVDSDDYRDDIMVTGRGTTTTTTRHSHSHSHSHNKGEKMLQSVDQSLLYLEVLRELLEKQENWEWVPYPCYPPIFSDVIKSIIKKKTLVLLIKTPKLLSIIYQLVYTL